MSYPRNLFFAIVVVAAGGSGAALLVAPGSTHRYFSWTLNPPAAAALIGGFYLASSAVFAWAITRPWRQARALLVGVLGLAVPTLVLSIVHADVFDFGRWQARAWMGLFVTAPVSATLLLVTGPPVEPGPQAAVRVRALLAVLSAVLLAAAIVIWAGGEPLPMDLERLTGDYLGAWCTFLALLCGFSALVGGRDEAEVALVTVAAASAGAALGLLRMVGDIRRPALSLTVCVVVGVAAVVAARTATSDGN